MAAQRAKVVDVYNRRVVQVMLDAELVRRVDVWAIQHDMTRAQAFDVLLRYGLADARAGSVAVE